MRLPATEHTTRPWRIHEFTRDFRLEDVWELGRGGPGEFPRAVEMITGTDPGRSSSRAVRALFAVRMKVGDLLGWDESHDPALPTVRDRLTADLRDAPAGPKFSSTPFSPLYLLEDEFAAEVANRTVHAVLHIGWVPLPGGDFRAQMAVLVKPNGLLGRGYLAAIRPFRYAIVYPAMLREGQRRWRELAGDPA